MPSYALQVAATSSGSTGSIDIDDVAGRKLSIWDLLRFTLPTLGVWVINPILRFGFACRMSPGKQLTPAKLNAYHIWQLSSQKSWP